MPPKKAQAKKRERDDAPKHPALKLAYFDTKGRGLVIRAVLEYAGIPLELEKIGFGDWASVKGDRARFPLGDVPVLSVDGVVVAESIPITIYAGELSGFWPTSPLDRAVALEALVTMELMLTGCGSTNLIDSFYIQDEKAKAAALAKDGPCVERVKYYGSRLDEIIGRNPKKLVAGDRLTVADISVSYIMNSILSGEWGLAAADMPELPNVRQLANHIKTDKKLQKIIDDMK